VQAKEYYVLTVHRAGNTEDAATLQRILDACEQLDRPVVFPVHPRTRRLLASVSVPVQVLLSEPLGYLDMLCLADHARAVLTDSGGLQKEAFFLEVPCVTLREETEWGETLEVGANVLAGTATARIVAAVQSISATPRQTAGGLHAFGDGQAAERICRLLLAGAGGPEAAVRRAGPG